MNNKYLIEDLRDFREWAESNIYEVPIELPDVLSCAADVIENMEKHIEVLQKEVEIGQGFVASRIKVERLEHNHKEKEGSRYESEFQDGTCFQ